MFFAAIGTRPESLYTMVYHTAEELIVRQGVTQFYCGGKGAFDRIAARAVYNLKIRIPTFDPVRFWPICRKNLARQATTYSMRPFIPKGWKRSLSGLPICAATGGWWNRRISSLLM